jgi:hypothetical protein
MNFSPKLIFWLTLGSMIGQGLTAGTIHLTGLVPESWIGPITGWISLLVFADLAFLSMATGYAGLGKGPLASAPSIPEARAVLNDAVTAESKKP